MAKQVQILIVEDNASDAELMKRELDKAGFDFAVQWAQGKETFLAALDIFTPDLILADHSLPGFDGLTAMASARQRWAYIPVIIVSGAIGEELAIETLKAGATDYVLKQRLGRLGPVVRRAIREAQEVAQRKQAEEALRQANEQLRERTARLRSQAKELRASEQRYRKLFEANLAAAYLTKLDGTILDFNDAMMRMLGYDSREEVFQRRSTDFYADPEFRKELIRLLQKDGIVPAKEAVLQRKDGSVLHALGSAVLLMDEQTGEPYIQGVAVDITERKHAEEALRQSEEQLRVAATAAGIGMWHWTPGTSNIVVTANWRRLFGVSEDAAVTFETWRNALHPEDREPAVRELNAAAAEHREFNVEYRIVRPDGTMRWIVDRGRASYDASGRPIHMAGVNVDITDRKQAEEALREWNATLESKVAQRTAELLHRTRQLQKLTLELSETEDRERKRMAEILHDDLQQILAAAKFHLSLMRNRVKYDASLQALAAQIDHMLKDAIEKSRSLSHELSPAVLYHGDFAETLRWLAGQMQAKHGLVVHVHAHGQVHLQSDAIKAFLYKTAQELLFNVVKHARVKEAEIRVRRCGRCVCVSVSDRGRGFDPQGLREAAGFGLLSIRERIELLGRSHEDQERPGPGQHVLYRRAGSRDVGTGSVGVGETERPGRPASRSGGHGGPPLRVLLADDHEIVRQGLAVAAQR